MGGPSRTNNASARLLFALAGHAIASFPYYDVAQDLQRGDLIELLSDLCLPDLALLAVVRTGTTDARASAVRIGTLKENPPGHAGKKKRRGQVSHYNIFEHLRGQAAESGVYMTVGLAVREPGAAGSVSVFSKRRQRRWQPAR